MTNPEIVVLPPHDDRDPIENVMRAAEIKALQEQGLTVVIQEAAKVTLPKSEPRRTISSDKGDSL